MAVARWRVDPLSPEEEALYREGLRDAPSMADADPGSSALASLTVAEWADRCRRLVATLDLDRERAMRADLDAAWQDLTATLPAGWVFWEVGGRARSGRVHARVRLDDSFSIGNEVGGHGPTLAEALRSLTANLREHEA